VTVMCQEGSGFSDKSAPKAFVATCVKDATTAVTVDYRGNFDKAMPVCEEVNLDVVSPSPPPPSTPPPKQMPADMQGLNLECSKWRDNKNGQEATPKKGYDLSFEAQLQQMAYCMQQDCMQSMSASKGACRFADANRLCYTLPGQLWCKDNPGNPSCQDLGEKAGDPTNLGGDGAWAPKQNVPVWGSAKLTAPSTTYACNCLKRCAHSTTPLKKYWCTGGVAGEMVGQITGSPAQDLTAASILNANKNDQCACSCGIVGQTPTWRPGNAQK
jgi:hypothetical protein